MKTFYDQDDDILVIRLSDEPVVKEVSQSWNVNISYDALGKVVEIVILEARSQGMFPVDTLKAA